MNDCLGQLSDGITFYFLPLVSKYRQENLYVTNTYTDNAILRTPQLADKLAHRITLACRTNIDIMYKMLHHNTHLKDC